MKRYLVGERYYFLDNIDIMQEDNEYPQGLCITEDYVLVSAYSDESGVLSKLYVFSNNTGIIAFPFMI